MSMEKFFLALVISLLALSLGIVVAIFIPESQPRGIAAQNVTQKNRQPGTDTVEFQHLPITYVYDERTDRCFVMGNSGIDEIVCSEKIKKHTSIIIGRDGHVLSGPPKQ